MSKLQKTPEPGDAEPEGETVIAVDEAVTTETASAPVKPYLTTQASETHGGRGTWHDLTDAQFAAAPEGLLVEPTADQLALRLT